MATLVAPIKAAEAPAGKPERKARKLQEKPSDTPNQRFFLGEIGPDGTLSLSREFPSEVAAQLESLKLDQPYHKIESWMAVADLSNGSIAVHKRPVGNKT